MSKVANGGCLAAVGLLMCIPFIGQCVLCFFLDLSFDRGCHDWLKMAADANSVAVAKERLDIAVKYLEDNHLTQGNTACIFSVPTTEIGPWYKNLKEAQHNLDNFPKNPTEADTSTALVKLRETLLDHGEHGDTVTVPESLFVYPHQLVWYVGWWITGIIGCTGALSLFVGCNEMRE